MLEKISFTDINRIGNREIVLFGSGNISSKTKRKLHDKSIAFIADNSENLQNTEFEGMNVKNPKAITKNHFVIICSTAVSDIATQLSKMGLKANSDFCISPLLNDLLAIAALEEIQTSFYFTSGTIPREEAHSGGGLYRATVNGLKVDLKKVYSGPCYGAINHNGNILFIDTDRGVMRFQKNGECDLIAALEKGTRAHGISYNESNSRFYISCSYLDSVLEFDEKFNALRTFMLSDKLKSDQQPMHHTNDNLALGNSLYVSMFSSTGNWKRDCFDGCIAEFDLISGERKNDISTGLYMPHNVKFYDGSLHILDSLPGHLRFNNFSIQGTFPAFTRGLNYKDGLYYIGQSKNRNYSKVMGISNNISIDCGVVIFNPDIKASRFIQFPHTIGEIHSIVFN